VIMLLEREDILLEKPCLVCGGRGRVERDGREAACRDCLGLGVVLTLFGASIIRLVERYHVQPGQQRP